MSDFNIFDVYYQAYRIREVELRIAAEYDKEEQRCPVHFSIGQEIVSVGVCSALEPDDKILLGHRCHAGYLAKGGDLNRMIAELYGKATGCAGGWGGSMHLVDESVGVLGTSAIVGSSISVATGIALAQKLSKQSSLTVAFFGDSGPETGQLYESMNFAALHRLPLLYVCEDNLYSTQTPKEKRQPKRDFTEVAVAMGVYAKACRDRGGASGIYDFTKQLCDRIRNGKGPGLLYIDTYRYRTHVGPEYDWDMGYRTKEEVDFYERLDPIEHLKNQLLIGVGGQDFIDSTKEKVQDEIDDAFRFAKDSPWPEALWK